MWVSKKTTENDDIEILLNLVYEIKLKFFNGVEILSKDMQGYVGSGYSKVKWMG